jgi:hypothetical protein
MKPVRQSHRVQLGVAAMTARNPSVTSSTVITPSPLLPSPLLQVPTYIGPPGRDLSHERSSTQPPRRLATIIEQAGPKLPDVSACQR